MKVLRGDYIFSCDLSFIGDQILSATVYFDNMSYEDAIQILEHAQAYKMKLCIKRQPDITESESTIESDAIPVSHLLSFLNDLAIGIT